MKKVVNFIKDYWITALICVGFVLLYKYISDHKLFSALMFPPLKGIWESFVEDRDVTVLNLVSSIKLLIPSVAITLAIALGLGVLVGMNSKLRKILHPIIYAFSCVPSILLSPFVVLLSPTFWWASVILIVYGTVWATLFATITGIQAIDKRYLDNAATLELKGMKRFFKVILPAASPSILSGFVNSLRSSFVMLVYAEMYGASHGLGFYVKRYSTLGFSPVLPGI